MSLAAAALAAAACASKAPAGSPDAGPLAIDAAISDAVAADASADAGSGSGSGGVPTVTSVAAAASTATTNALCTAISPFYWEIGDATGALASGSIGVGSDGNPITGATRFSIASASKWMYGTYVVQQRGAAASLTAQDIDFLHFTSGYSNMGGNTTTSQCPSTDTPDTVNTCLTLLNSANGRPFSYQDPSTIGKFDYDGGHLENHASQLGGLGDTPNAQLGATLDAVLGGTLAYSEPLLAGGLVTNSDEYTSVLRHVLDGSLHMRDALGTSPVCTRKSASCNAVFSPIPEAWHYSIAHWVEDDPATHGDGAFSSPGAFGFYPWIESGKQLYGVVSRAAPSGGGEQRGYESAQCGRLIRRAFDTGVAQTGTIPD